MNIFLKITFSVLLLCLLNPFAIAQKSVDRKASSLPSETKKLPPSKDEDEDERMRKQKIAERHQQALLMLKGVVAEAQKLDVSVMKVKTLSQVADALWEYDQTQARRLFTDAFASIGLINSDKSKALDRQLLNRESGKVLELRRGLLELTARRDAKLAEELRNTLDDPSKDDSKGSKTTPPSEKEMLAWASAIGASKTQPEQTARFVNSYLSSGISRTLVAGLSGIHHQNPSLADQLFNNAVQVARIRQNTTGDVAILAEYILHHEYMSAEEQKRTAIGGFLIFVLEGAALKAAAGNPVSTEARENQEEYSMLQGLLPFFNLNMPDKIPIIENRMGILRIALAGTQDKTSSSLPQTRTADDWVKVAERLPRGKEKDRAFMQAARAAFHEGDIDRAISLAEKIDDEGARSLTHSNALQQASLKSLDTGSIEEAHRLAQGIGYMPIRVDTFLKITDKLRVKKELARALEILEEIWGYTIKSDNSYSKAQALLVLTAMMTKQDAERGFEFLRATIRTIDQVDPTLPDLNSKILKASSFALDELSFSEPFSLLSRIDFERTARLAQTFNNKELALFAQVIACQQELLRTSKEVLTSNPTKK